MAISILGGKFKGRALKVPTKGTRPTSILLRRRLFDRYQNFQGKYFLDLCAGSGAVGIEALSRGAEQVTFVESDAKATQLISSNLQQLELEKGQCQVRTQKVKIFFNQWAQDYQQIAEDKKRDTIVFFDPPYELHGLYQDLFEGLGSSNNDGGKWFCGLLWIESEDQKGPSEETLVQNVKNCGGQVDKVLRQGTSFLLCCSFYNS